MYLKKIVCENMGPISYVDIEPGFTKEGNPKPLILVGKNGTGKSILISNIVDSFFEFGDQAYTDVTEKQNMGHAYFKITGGDQIKIGQKNLGCFLQYETGNDRKKIGYLYHCGEFNFDSFKEKIGTSYTFPSYNEENEKSITTDTKLFEKEFDNNVLVYFPPERFSVPYWMGNAYSTSHDYGTTDLKEKFRNILNRPIIADNETDKNIKWLIDVLADAKANIIVDTNGKKMVEWTNNNDLLRKSKLNIENIFSEILEDTVSIELGWRNTAKSRLNIKSITGNKTIAPTLDALSTGQMVLLNMFLTIVRYADSNDINKCIWLERITGTVVIDEIEMHLHSDLQRKILPRLINLFPKVQFIITSHSPLFLLGMQEVFDDDKFDIYEMPNGTRIEAESFSEFGKAYEIIAQTKTYQHDIDNAIKNHASDTKALIITEGASDWKHLLHAWQKFKDQPEYAELVDQFEFLQYEPVRNPPKANLELQMGDSEMVKACETAAKFPQSRKLIFIVDADQPEKTKKMVQEGKKFKDWGNQVFSFQIPIPEHRNDQRICIEHYYSDEELKTEKDIKGKKCRLFLGNEFDSRGISLDKKYVCSPATHCGSDKNTILEGDAKARVTLYEDETITVGLPKTKFAEAILHEEDNFKNIDSSNFRLIFNVIRDILIPQQVTVLSNTEQSKQGEENADKN